MRDELRQHVSELSTSVDYHELDFQPERRSGLWSLKQGKVTHEGVV